MLWLVTRVSLRLALLVSAFMQAASVLMIAISPAAPALLISSSLAGAAAVLFQVSASPFMMRHSSNATRDHLFSANAAILIGLAGIGSLLAGQLPGLAAGWLGVGAESALAYRAALAVAGVGLTVALLPLLLLPKDGRTERDIEAEPSQIPAKHAPTIPPNRRSRFNLQSTIYNLQSTIQAAWRTLAPHPLLLLRLVIPPALISVGAPYLGGCERAAAMDESAARTVAAAITAVLEGRSEHGQVEYLSRTPTGARWFEMVVEPLRRPEGGALVSHVDVTRRRHAEDLAHRQREELARTLRATALGQVATSLAHEVNQPLAAIVANAQATLHVLDASLRPDLHAARRTNVAVTVLTVLAVFLIGTRLTNRVGGAVGAALFAVHPLTRNTATHTSLANALLWPNN